MVYKPGDVLRHTNLSPVSPYELPMLVVLDVHKYGYKLRILLTEYTHQNTVDSVLYNYTFSHTLTPIEAAIYGI